MATVERTPKQFAMSRIKTDGEVNEQVYDYICSLAEKLKIDPTTIAWLSGNPYPMQAALFAMLQNKCEDEGLVVTSIKTEPVQRAEDKNGGRAMFSATVKLFDQKGFDAIMKKAKEMPPVEVLKELRELYTHEYKEEGNASKESVKMRTLHVLDYINHMGQTRAIDRTLKIVVRCPFTAESELPEGGEGVPVSPEGDVPLSKPGEKAPAKDEPPVSKPGERKVGDKPIKPAKASKAKKDEKKSDKITEQQVDLALIRWDEYCKEAAPGIAKKDIDGKRVKLLKALFNKEQVKELKLPELEEWLGLMDKKEIEVSVDQGEVKS